MIPLKISYDAPHRQTLLLIVIMWGKVVGSGGMWWKTICYDHRYDG